MSKIRYTHLEAQYCKGVYELIQICFPDMPPEDQFTEADLLQLAEIFPQGTILAHDGERVVGMGTGVFLNLDFDNLPPTEQELLYDATTNTSKHNPEGDYYYGSDMAVHPDYRGKRIGRAIYNRRKALLVEHNRIGFAAAAVLPGFANHKDKIDIDTYIEQVLAGNLFDPTLSMQLRNGFRFIRVIKDFFIFPRSDNWCALIVWENPNFTIQ